MAKHALSDCLLALARADKAHAWEGGESAGLHPLDLHLTETGVPDEGGQLLQVAPTSVKTRGLTLAFLLALEIGDDQPPGLSTRAISASPCGLSGAGR